MSQILPQVPPTERKYPRPVHHFGKSVLSPPEVAEQNEWLAQVRLFHACDQCKGGEYRLESCRQCRGRGYFLPRAVAERLGVARFLYAEEGRVSQG